MHRLHQRVDIIGQEIKVFENNQHSHIGKNAEQQ
jgi:hypothetical protein